MPRKVIIGPFLGMLKNKLKFGKVKAHSLCSLAQVGVLVLFEKDIIGDRAFFFLFVLFSGKGVCFNFLLK